MPHPEVLVEMDLEKDTRWYTVRGEHYAFAGAEIPHSPQPNGFGEEAGPDHPNWTYLIRNNDCYNQRKAYLISAYPTPAPNIPVAVDSRPGLCPESVDWEAHRAFLRSL